MRLWLVFLVCVAVLGGCSIKINENGNHWDDDWKGDGWDHDSTQQERAADVCDPYCIDLIDCGVLSDTAFVSCRDLCMERFLEDESGVTEGCACVEAAQCQASAAQGCEGDPLPGVLGNSSSKNPSPGPGGASNGGDYTL